MGRLLDEAPPTLLVLQEPAREGGRYLCLPVFGLDWWATDRDLLLSDDEWFLAGERWLATDIELRVPKERFYRCSGEADQHVLDEIERFRTTGETRLERGPSPLAPELGDPRVGARRRWEQELFEWVTLPSKIVVIMGETTMAFKESGRGQDGMSLDLGPSSGKSWGFLEAARHMLDGFKDGAATLGAVFTPLAPLELAAAVARGRSSRASVTYPVTVGDYNVQVVVTPGRKGAAVALKVEADEVLLETDQGWNRLDRDEGDLWTLPATMLLEFGAHRFRVVGEHGDRVLEILLQEAAEGDEG